MALTQLHVRDVCHGGGWTPSGQSNTCKYLTHECRKDGTYVSLCTKLNKGAYDDLEKSRKNSNSRYQPKGDNCAGYLYLLYKKQGYDV